MADVRWPEASEYALKNLRGRGRLAVLDLDVAERGILKNLPPCQPYCRLSYRGRNFNRPADITSAPVLSPKIMAVLFV